MSVKHSNFVNLNSSSDEHQNGKTPSPPPRKKSLSPLQVPSKSISSELTLFSLDVSQVFNFFLQIGLTLIIAALEDLDLGLLGDVISEDDCGDDGEDENVFIIGERVMVKDFDVVFVEPRSSSSRIS
ncbi:hypothetical protein Tco_0857323 [Tanacetum coccineum]|uniref:Uncharacterized protein n=1 Tax=Tanacetum coccineum TaxID=301880 RepID=A0ABQ5B5X2_9ASTR